MNKDHIFHLLCKQLCFPVLWYLLRLPGRSFCYHSRSSDLTASQFLSWSFLGASGTEGRDGKGRNPLVPPRASRSSEETNDMSRRHYWFPAQNDLWETSAILITCYYPDLGNASDWQRFCLSDWLKQISHAARPKKKTKNSFFECQCI